MTFLYRINGGQVLGASVDAAAYANIDATLFGVLTNPTLLNGADLGVAKIWDGTRIRNATNPEITAFATAAAQDQIVSDRAIAKAWFQSNPVQRKVLRAIVSVIVDELNILRANDSLAPRTTTQAYTAVLARIDDGTVD